MASFNELLFDSDSDDEYFMGFETEEINNNDTTYNIDGDIELSDDELRAIREEIEKEERDPAFDAYDDKWLMWFTEIVGPIHVHDAVPYAIFEQLFDIDIVDMLVDETNRYYDQQMTKQGGVDSLPTHSRFRKFVNVSRGEMKAFIAIVLFMGLVRLPNYKLYWNTHHLLSLNIASIMPRDRFMNIMTFFHACNNMTQPPVHDPTHDPAYKVNHFSKMLIRNWRHVYTPCREVSIDECLVPFKGRSKHLQYIPSKPHKWGIKVWCLSESGTGYVTNWSMYTGKLKPDGSQRTATHRIVMDICDPILDKGRHVYMDNFFTSPALYTELAERQTGACGTLRTNRTGVPQAVKTADPPLGEVMSQKEGKLLYITWKDKRRVNILSTIHNSSTYTKKLRSRFSENHHRDVDRPKAIGLYSKYMSGGDITDQQLAYNCLQHRMLKWWKKVVLCNLLEITMANAKVIYKKLGVGNYNNDTFRLAIIEGLLEGYEKPQKHSPDQVET